MFTGNGSRAENSWLNSFPKISLGGGDANSLNASGIESVNLGIGAQNPHSNDEFIFIEDLVKSAEIAMELVRKKLKDDQKNIICALGNRDFIQH